VKAVYIEASKECLEEKGQKVTDSRLSVISGIHRRDVTKFKDEGFSIDASKNLISKIVGQWQTDSDFTTAVNKPRVLSCGFKDSEFDNLVKRISQDLNPATVLFELERLGTAVKSERGVQLHTGTFIPRGDLNQGFKILADDSNDLLNAVEQNLLEENKLENHHLRTTYDGIRSDKVEEIKAWLLKEGSEFHRKARQFISQYDQDVNPVKNFKGKLSKVVLSSFAKTYKDEL